MIERIFVFIFGSVIGSFLNVCIHRMPQEGYSLIRPGSHCPQCKKPILWYDNIPLLSYIILGGRCRFCKQRIRIRYFIVELLTALTLLLLYNYYGRGQAPPLQITGSPDNTSGLPLLIYDFLFYSIFLAGLIIATFIDIQHRIIPDEISVGGIVVGFLLSFIKGFIQPPASNLQHPAFDSFLGVLIGGGIIYLTGILFDLVYFRLLKKPPIQGETESMGGGDVKLLAMIGAFLGWEKALLTFFLAPFFGAVIGVINLIAKKDHTIPYGPFLSLAAVLSLFWADKIIALVILR